MGMERIEPKSIIHVLDALIGPVRAVGDAAKDREIEKNIYALTEVMSWCVEQLIESSYDRNRSEESAQKIGKKAYATLKVYRDWLREVTEEGDSGKE